MHVMVNTAQMKSASLQPRTDLSELLRREPRVACGAAQSRCPWQEDDVDEGPANSAASMQQKVPQSRLRGNIRRSHSK